MLDFFFLLLYPSDMKELSLNMDVYRQLALVEQSENEAETVDVALVQDIALRTSKIADGCPNPKRGDIHKLMALQAHALGEFGLMFLGASQKSVKNKKFYLDYAMRLLRESKDEYTQLLKDPTFDMQKFLPEPEPDE